MASMLRYQRTMEPRPWADPEGNHRKNAHSFCIGSVTISFFFDHELPRPKIVQETQSDLEGGAPQIELRVCYSPPPACNDKERIFDAGTTWALFRIKHNYLLQDASVCSGNQPNTFLILEEDMKSGVLYLNRDTFGDAYPSDPVGYPLNQVLMILLLSQGKGLLVHACGIGDREKGYLFLGNSGHGKSTMARLWHDKGASVLNDDRIVLREKDGAFWMYGTPWHGDFKEHSAEGLPIQKIFFLSRGRSNGISPKHGAEAVSMLLTRSFPPLWDKEGMAFTMDFCHGVTQKVPCCELRFVPDERVIDFVRNT